MPEGSVRRDGMGSPEPAPLPSAREKSAETARPPTASLNTPDRAGGQMFFSGRLGCGGASIRFLSSLWFGFPLPLPGFGAFTPV